MNFSQFKLAYNIFLILLKITIFLVLILWVKNSYHYAIHTKLIELLTDFSNMERNFSNIWGIFKIWLIDGAWVLSKIISINVIAGLTKRTIIPSKCIGYWDSIGNISPAFGRLITRHFRYHKTINCRTFIELHNDSVIQMSLINYHNSNPHIKQLFEKYDLNFNSDIKINKK